MNGLTHKDIVKASSEKLKEWIASGYDLDVVSSAGKNALFKIECPERIDILLSAGVKANRLDIGGKNPLYSHENKDIIQMLLRAGADPNCQAKGTGSTFIFMPKHRKNRYFNTRWRRYKSFK